MNILVNGRGDTEQALPFHVYLEGFIVAILTKICYQVLNTTYGA